MIVILCVAVLCALLYILFSPTGSEYRLFRSSDERPYTFGFCVAVVISMAVHFVCAIMYEGHSTDINCFRGWSDLVYSGGFSGFYTSDSFTDYPPGYMYVLYVVGFLRSITGYNNFVVKLPAIIGDLLLGIWIYRISRRKLSERASLTLSAFTMFSPVLILNSALWGQVDIIYSFLVAVFVWLISEKRLIQSYYIFALAFFVKPQALIFTPVLLCGILRGINRQNIIKNVLNIFLAAIMVLVLSVPFGLKETVSQYISTLGSYPYATVNAFNIYGAMGLNWEELNGFVSFAGTTFIVFIVVFVLWQYVTGNKNLFFLAGVLSFATYMLSAKMHERYAYPAVILFLLAYIFRPQKRSMQMFVLTSLSQFINTAWVLFVYEQDINKYYHSPFIVVFSILNIVLLAYMIYSCIKLPHISAGVKREESQEPVFRQRVRTITSVGITKKDAVLIIALTALYAVLSFYDLGDMTAPQTYHDIGKSPVTISFGEPEFVKKLAVYPSCNDTNETRHFSVSYTREDGTADNVTFEDLNVFTWNFEDFNESVTSITFASDSERFMVMEIGMVGENGLISGNDTALFDEQEFVPERRTYKNGAYFDEIYHARTGYEFVHGFNVYEWTHPPLGKVFIAAGIKLFGMTPFGWRIAGNIFGILMVPVFYIFAKKLFGKTWIAFLTTVLFTFDFMHFVQTRIATIDVYVTFFIMLMYLFMYRYYQMSFYDTPLKKTFIPLLLTGIAFGLGVSCKWTAIYACAGIAVIYFLIMMVRYNESYRLTDEKLPFGACFIKSCCFCGAAFIVIPVIIYVLSYIPYLFTENADGLKTVIENQKDIFIYHSKTVLGSEHPYASPWYTWPVMVRPIWYYSGTVSETVKEGISAFGNPAVWWVGTVAVLYNIYLAVMKNDRKALYLLIGYFSCLLPWIPVARTTYIYHYFPCVPFATLMIGHSVEGWGRKGRMALAVCAVVAVVLFAAFYPVLSGHGINAQFAENFLRWFDTWVLI